MEQTSSGIGLGWLLAIAIGGAVLLFTTIGLLLVWWIKRRNQPNVDRVYEYSNQSALRPSSTRLTKQRLLGSESASRFSISRFSMSTPPMLPLLPTYNSIGFSGPGMTMTTTTTTKVMAPTASAMRGRKRSRSWVDEDDLHGPKMVNKGTAETWFSRDSWLGRVPTLPNVDGAEKDEVEANNKAAGDGQWVEEQQYDSEGLQESAESSADDVPMGRGSRNGRGDGMVQVPPLAHVQQPSVTETDLNVILQSTEMRLRDKSRHRSPVKTPGPSPVRGNSPTKTPHSHRTTGSQGSVRDWHATPGSGKRLGTAHGISKNDSVSSIGSAANSLIAAATRELELELQGGSSNSSVARGMQQHAANRSPERAQRESPRRQILPVSMPPMVPVPPIPRMPAPQMQKPSIQNPPTQHLQRSPERRMSRESDESSSLSTLYSINEPEEKKNAQDDPFVDKGFPRRRPTCWRPSTASASQKHKKTLSSPAVTRYATAHQSAMPSPLRPCSTVSQPGVGREGMVSVMSASGAMLRRQPSAAEQQFEDTLLNNAEYLKTSALSEAPSEGSFVSVSVDSDSDGTEVPASDTPRAGSSQGFGDDDNPTTPTMKRITKSSELSLSPYDEQEMMSLLLATASEPRRALPIPPTSVTGPDGNVLMQPSPRPRSLRGNAARSLSTSSSIYTVESILMDASATSMGSPSRGRSMDELAVGSTISELRRINSMVSSYSVASMASTVMADGDSPTIPALLTGGLPKNPRPVMSHTSATTTISSRYYFNNVGGGPAGHQQQQQQLQPAAASRRRQPNRLPAPDPRSHGREVHGLGLRDGRRDPATQAMPRGPNRPRLGSVEELVAEDGRQNQEHQRESVASLGLYDKKGFLIEFSREGGDEEEELV